MLQGARVTLPCNMHHATLKKATIIIIFVTSFARLRINNNILSINILTLQT
jgi:hypothetical protein